MSQRTMRPVVRRLTDLHVALYRRTGGRAQAPRHPTLLLTVTGRRTGRVWTVPLVYIEERTERSTDWIVAAAYAGSDRDPTWWLNLQHHPAGIVELDRRRIAVRAEAVADDEREGLWRRLVAMYPPFAEYQQRTTRRIPIIRLRPDPEAG